ncbi:MAG: hypothetical protein ACUVR4_14995 [Anaerolineae bacterium]
MNPYQPVRRPPRTWIEFEAPEVIELKRIVLDKDAAAAVAFFQDVVVPKVRAAAERHGMRLPIAEELDHERLPG